jgi:hypothetical protein
MSGAADPVTRLEGAIGPVARTFTELRAQIANSTFTEQWKSDGTWATGVLADALREDWLGRFQAKSGPYLKFVLAPHRLPQLASGTVMSCSRYTTPTTSRGCGRKSGIRSLPAERACPARMPVRASTHDDRRVSVA